MRVIQWNVRSRWRVDFYLDGLLIYRFVALIFDADNLINVDQFVPQATEPFSGFTAPIKTF